MNLNICIDFLIEFYLFLVLLFSKYIIVIIVYCLQAA